MSPGPRSFVSGSFRARKATEATPNPGFLAGLPFAVVAGVALVDVLAGPGVGFLPVLSLGPALAAISRPPLPTALIGMPALACAVLLAFYDNLDGTRRGVIALCDIAVRYVSAAASARIGGDLYEAVSVGGGVRLIVGDVLGKGLSAARTAAVVLGAFRESAGRLAGARAGQHGPARARGTGRERRLRGPHGGAWRVRRTALRAPAHRQRARAGDGLRRRGRRRAGAARGAGP